MFSKAHCTLILPFLLGRWRCHAAAGGGCWVEKTEELLKKKGIPSTLLSRDAN